MKWIYRLAIVGIMLATIIGCAGSFRSLTPDMKLAIVTGSARPLWPLTPDMIRTDLESVRKKYGVPSLGVAEVTADNIVIYGPVGKGGADSDRPLSAGSYYQLASCTKAMTATALVKLMQQDHAMSWDTRLLDLFPEFAATANPAYREVTLGDIASHQAGFQGATDYASFFPGWDHGGSLAQYLGEILQQRPHNRRGYFHYSNNGYAALGAVIERRTGLAYPEAMDKLLFEPLGIKAHFGYPKDLGPDQPWGHTSMLGAVVPVRIKKQVYPNVLGPAGIISMTLPDLARFLQLHLRGLLGRDDAGYTADMIDQVHQPRIMTDWPPLESYAAGWYVGKFNNETVHRHNGSNSYFIAHMIINPARKKGIVVVTNIGDIRGDLMCYDIQKSLLTDGPALQ